MTLGDLFKESRRKLTGETADFDLNQLVLAQFGQTIGTKRPEAEVSAEDAFIFQMKVKRLADGYPLQYLIGEWEFYSIPLKVGEGVLIPRPDTETVVDAVLETAAQMKAPVIADLCSGSGAIAIAVAKNLPDATVYAVERSPEALSYLYDNIEANGLTDRVQVVEGDVFERLELPPLDLIVSNPPYIRRADLDGLPVQVSFEPRMALDGGEDGLDFYRQIAKSGRWLLRPGGYLFFEAGYDQAGDIAEILSSLDYSDITRRLDLSKVERCVFGKNAGILAGAAGPA